MRGRSTAVAAVGGMLCLISTHADAEGWRLLEPPLDPKRPLAEWSHIASFDTATDCEKAKLARLERVEINADGSVDLTRFLNALDGRCVPFAEPRTSDRTAPADLYERLAGNVVTIVTYDGRGQMLGQGSGIVSRNGTLFTALHVLRGAGSAVAIFRSGQRSPVVGILADSERTDLAVALIDLPRPLPEPKAVVELPRVGERVFALGAPLGLGWSISEGIVSGVRRDPVAGSSLLQFTAPISPGSSGGPLLNEEGHVIGIVVALLERGQQLNFAVPIGAARNLERATPPVLLSEWRWGPGHVGRTGDLPKPLR